MRTGPRRFFVFLLFRCCSNNMLCWSDVKDHHEDLCNFVDYIYFQIAFVILCLCDVCVTFFMIGCFFAMAERDRQINGRHLYSIQGGIGRRQQRHSNSRNAKHCDTAAHRTLFLFAIVGSSIFFSLVSFCLCLANSQTGNGTCRLSGIWHITHSEWLVADVARSNGVDIHFFSSMFVKPLTCLEIKTRLAMLRVGQKDWVRNDVKLLCRNLHALVYYCKYLLFSVERAAGWPLQVRWFILIF